MTETTSWLRPIAGFGVVVAGAISHPSWIDALAIVAIIICKALDKAPDIIRACRRRKR